MKKILITSALILGFATTAQATKLGEPCTTVPKDKWMTLEAIEKIVRDHGYEIVKSKIENACVEIYARDKQGTRVEYFIDPVTGNPVGAEWKNPSK